MKQYFNGIVVGTIASLLALYISSLIILTTFHSMLLSKFNDGFRLIVNTNTRSHEP